MLKKAFLVIIMFTGLICTACVSNDIGSDISLQMEGMENKTLSSKELGSLERFEAVYSAVNNWPSQKTYAAKGITIESLLKSIAADPKQIVFEADDGYRTTLTYEQLFAERKSFSDGKETIVKPILAYSIAEGNDIKDAKSCGLTLIFGQLFADEHTNIAFVENITRITLLNDEPEKWDIPSCFPNPGVVAKGDGIKLQHEFLGLLKVYYTTDGSDPDDSSTLYNPSTYQPDLNEPIIIAQNMVIKAKAVGFGKKDSDISEFKFEVNK